MHKHYEVTVVVLLALIVLLLTVKEYFSYLNDILKNNLFFSEKVIILCLFS